MQRVFAKPPGEIGQSSTELLLVCAVLVFGLISVSYVFAPRLERGVSSVGDAVAEALDRHKVAGQGVFGPKTPGPNNFTYSPPAADINGSGATEGGLFGVRDARYRETLNSEFPEILTGRDYDIVHSPMELLPDTIG